jgi:hypothetical protein
VTSKQVISIISIVVSVVGICLVWNFGSWQLAVGVVTILWGHNLERHARG